MLIGNKEPDWRSIAYQNGEEVEMASTDFSGSWHVLYFYPLDFTFICPTEINGFEALAAEFAAEDVAVIGVSTDSYFSHLAWFKDSASFPQGVSHPVLADTSHAVSRAFGVLKEDQGIAYRATIIVDDKGVVRSVSINDLDAGRSPAETLRTVQALKSGGLCGADWQKGRPFAA